MAKTTTRKTPKAEIAALRAEAEGLQGTTFATLKPKLATLVGALENLQRGNSATEAQRKAVVEALQQVKTDPSFQYSNGVTSALEFISDLKRLQGASGITLDAIPTEKPASKPADAEKIEAIESASSRVLGIRQTMDSKVNQDVFELTGNFVTIANKWAGSQTRNASKPEKLAASNLALSEAIWELTKLGEDLLAEYGLKEIVGELVTLHGATKPETPHSRGTTIEIEPRVVPVAIDPRDATEETLPEALKKFSDSLADGTQKAAFAELADAYAAYLAASDEERYKIGGVTWDTDQKLRAAINTITEEGTAKDLLRKCVATPDFRGLTTKLETADLLGSESYSEADLISRLASALDIELNTDAPKTVFDDLREKLLSDPFLDNLNYSHGVDRETVDQAIVYLAGQEHGERAARGFLKSFNGSDVTIDDRGFKNGFTKCALFLIAANHVMRNKINKTGHYKKLRDSLITEMAATVPPTLDGFVPADSPLPISNEALAFTSGGVNSASDELDFDTLLKEYVKDDLVADDVLFFINDQENAEALKTALKNALTNPEGTAATLSALDDSISLAEYIRNIESLEERMLARLNGAEDVLESSEISYLRHTLQPKLGESEAAAISAAIEGRNIEGAADAVASIMLKQRELFSQEISEKLQSIDIAVTAPALAINEEADKETVPEAIQQASALETLREKLARMETDVQNLPDTEEKADIQKTFTAFSARLEEFAATDVALEDFAESIDNYYISRANLGAAWEEFSNSVEFARNVNIDSKEYAALDTALDDLGDDLAAALSEQSAACIVYQSYVDSITQNLSHKPFKPAFLTWNGNINAVKNLKTILAGHPYNRHALDAVRLAQNTNSENTTEVYATRNLLKAIYAVKSGTNPMTEKPVRDALKYLIALGRAIEENASRSEKTLETADTREEEAAEEPVIPSLGAAQQQTAGADETPPQMADAPADPTTGEADETNRLRTELHAKIKELFAIGGRIRNVYNIDLLRLRVMPDFSQKSLERLIKFTEITINSDDKLEARKAIKTLASVWFDDREAAKEAWNTIKTTIDDDRDARHFGHENLNLRNDLVSATKRLCEMAGISDEREISAVTFAALNSAAAGRDQQVRKGRLVYLHDYIKSVSENVPNEEAARLAHFAAGVQTLRNIDTPEAQAALVDSVKAYRQAKHEASVRAEMETLTDSLDELFAGRYDRATVPAAELQKYCKTPEQIHRISRYIDSMLQGRDDAKIKDAITTLKSVVSGEVQDRLAALSRIKAHVQALDNSEALDVDARSMAARVAASAPTDTGSERREPVLTTTGTGTNADSEPDLVAALGTARGPAAGTRRAPSLDDGVDARRTHIEEELRPEIGDSIYEVEETQDGGKIRKALAKYFINEPEGLKEDSKRWRNHVVAASLKTTALFTTAGLSISGFSAGIGGAVANLSGYTLLASTVSIASLPISMPALVGGIIVGGTVGYISSKIIKAYYNARLDSLAVDRGELTSREKKTEIKQAKQARKAEIKEAYSGISNWPKRRLELARFSAQEIARNFPDRQALKAFFRKETLKDMSVNMLVGASFALLARTSITLTTFLATGDTEAAVSAWTTTKIRSGMQAVTDGLETAQKGIGASWKSASTLDFSDITSVFAGGNALIGEFLKDTEFLRARGILENIAAGDTTPTGDLGERITALLAALDKRDAASLPALAELLEKLASEGGEKRLAHALGESALAKFASITDPAFADGKVALTDVTARIKAEIDAAEAIRAATRLAAADVTAITDALPRVSALTRVDQIVARLANGADKTALTEALRDLRAGKIESSANLVERLAAMNRGGLATELRNQLVEQLEGKLGLDANKDIVTRLKGISIAVNPAAEAIADATTTSERFGAFIRHDAGMQRVLDTLQSAMDKTPDAATKAHLKSILENVRGPRPNPALVLGAIDTYAEWLKFKADGTYTPMGSRPEGLPSLEDRRAFAQTVRTSMREHLLTVTEGDAKAQKYLKLASEDRMPTDTQRIGSIAVTRVNPVNLAETLSARGYNIVSGTGDRIIIAVPRGESARLPIFGELNPTFAKTFGMASATDSIQYPVRIWPTDTLIGKVANSIQLSQIRSGFSPVELDLIVDQAQQGDKGSLAKLKAMAEGTLGGNRENRALLAELRKLEASQPRLRR